MALAPSLHASGCRLGLNVAGFFRAELGIGEAARRLLVGLDAGSVPYTAITYTAGIASRQEHPFDYRIDEKALYDVNVICVNAAETRRFAFDVGPGFFAGRHSVGFWWWEVSRFPPALYSALGIVDEIWVGSRFVAEAIEEVADKPVMIVPLPVPDPGAPVRSRDELALPDGYLFLFVFDFFSVFERKNPVAVIEAFERAFEPGEGARLLVKSINGDKFPVELDALRNAASRRDDIAVLDGYVHAAEKDSLIAACDCYVSLHRSEGFGLTIAEAMAYGKPVVATGYSGNVDYMDASNSYPVGYELRPIPEGCGPYPAGAVWAEPNVEEAARLLRQVFDEQDEARAVGARARESILRNLSAERTGRAVRERLEDIEIRRAQAQPTPAWGTAASLHAAVVAAERAVAEADAAPVSGRLLAAPVRIIRRLLARVLAPYLGPSAPPTSAALEVFEQLVVAYQIQCRELDELRLELAKLRETQAGGREGR